MVVPKHGRGLLKQGGNVGSLPIPGPGAPSKEAKLAKQLEDDAFELAMLEEHGELIQAAIAQAKLGNWAPLKDYKDRHRNWGPIAQKITITIENKDAVAILARVYLEVPPGDAVEFMRRGLEALQVEAISRANAVDVAPEP